jgi:hypothetical protein
LAEKVSEKKTSKSFREKPFKTPFQFMSKPHTWSEEELKKLISAVVAQGKSINWLEVADDVETKRPRTCHEKWQMICELVTADKRSPWKDNDDKTLIRFRQESHMGWYLMSDFLNVPPMWLKNRYQTLMKKRVKPISRPNSAPIPTPMIRLKPSSERPKTAGKKVSEKRAIKPMMKDPLKLKEPEKPKEPEVYYAGKRVPYGCKAPMMIELVRPKRTVCDLSDDPMEFFLD